MNRLRPFLPLLLPLATLVGYLLIGSFVLRSATTLLCLAIVLTASIARQRIAYSWWIVAAFALSFAGDYVLGHWGGCFAGFVSGVGLFLLAHLGYLTYCLRQGRLCRWLLVLLLLTFGTYFIVFLRPAIADDLTRYAVLAYILVSCLSLSAAAGLQLTAPPSRILFIAGIASLLFSDLLIAQKRFLHDGTLYALMMPTYFASQLLITTAIIRRSTISPPASSK